MSTPEPAAVSATRIVLRPIASPLPLGFFGLSAATFVFAGLQLGWVEAAEGHKVALVILAFTVPLQFVASIFGFLARDPTAATGMALLSGTWLAIALVTLSSTPGSTSDALGLFLLVAAVAIIAPALAAATGKWVPAAVLATASLRFFLGGLHQLTGNEVWENAAGVIGLGLAALAVYAAYAAELEDAFGRQILPLGRRGKGVEAIQQPLSVQLADIAHKPGVRKQL